MACEKAVVASRQSNKRVLVAFHIAVAPMPQERARAAKIAMMFAKSSLAVSPQKDVEPLRTGHKNPWIAHFRRNDPC
jgi:hypothetical protein